MCLPSCNPLLQLLPDPAVLSGWLQFGLGVGAGRAPDGVAATLHDGTGAGSHRADVCGRPVALQQPVQPATQRRSGQAGVGLGLLDRAEAHWQPQYWVQSVEALLHVGVSCRAAVQPQGVLWRLQGGERRSQTLPHETEHFF